VKKASLERFYSLASDFNDSLSLMAIMLIVHKKTDMDFVEVKGRLAELECDDCMIDSIEDLSLSIPSQDMGRLIRLLSPIDGLMVRERPRDIPSPVTLSRKSAKVKVSKPKARKIYGTLF